MRREPHDDSWIPWAAIVAILTFALLFMWATWTHSDTPAPPPSSAPDHLSRDASVASGGNARTSPPTPLAAQLSTVQRQSVRPSRGEVRATLDPTATAAPPEGEAGGASGVPWPWNALANCETEDASTTAADADWRSNTGNGYYGGLQFSLTSWRGVGGAGYPHDASITEQIHRGELLQAEQGWGAWPTCSQIVGVG